MKTYYITTPIYYVNDVPHIGHAYTTIAADVLARWKRLRGEKVFFLTGTDEHGAKIANMAAQRGTTPQAWSDGIVAEFKRLWTSLEIANDDFIRTTEPRHEKVVQGIFEKLKKSGDIYKSLYEGWYCTPDETFFNESDLVKVDKPATLRLPGGDVTLRPGDYACPDCGRPVEKLQEESYFFNLEKYRDRLLALYRDNPGFLQPAHRANEIVNFVKELKNLSVSRTKVKWGIAVPSDPGHTIYVWFDALINYLSATGYDPEKGWDEQAAAVRDLWPADVHLVGKEIYRFHTVIWPAMLMALDVPRPRRVFAHGWWTVEGQKMSKSLGNVVDPHKVAEEYGVDALRYFVLREIPFGGDGDYSKKGILGRYNAELANALGNLLNRTLNLIEKNNAGKVPEAKTPLITFEAAAERINKAMENLAFNEALDEVMGIINEANRFIDQQAPWKKVKTDLPGALDDLLSVLRRLKFISVALHPFMPEIAREMWRQLGEKDDISASGKILTDGRFLMPTGQATQKGAPLFPRKDVPA